MRQIRMCSLRFVLGLTVTATVVGSQGMGLAVPRYLGQIDYETSPVNTVLSMGPMLGAWGGYLLLSMETDRINNLSRMATLDGQVKDAWAVALTTNTVKDYRVAAEADIQGARFMISKIKADVQFYENKYKDFKDAKDEKYRPVNPAAATDFRIYWPIRQALVHYEYNREVVKDGRVQQEAATIDNAEATLETHVRAFQAALLTVIGRLNQVATTKDNKIVVTKSYGLSSLRVDRGYLQQPTADLRDTIFSISVMAEQLYALGKTPKNQLRATFVNTSKDLVFFIQVESWNTDGSYTLRPDTALPTVLYPDVSTLSAADKAKLQIQPVTNDNESRGHTVAVLPVALRDHVIVRVATMGQLRDRIRFQPVRGGSVYPDLSSLSRNFYYLGYESETPQGVSLSQWFPVEERYDWRFGGEWQMGGKITQLMTSTAEQISQFRPFSPWGEGLTLVNDRLQWQVPESIESARNLEGATADVSGTATFRKCGPSVTRPACTNFTETAGTGGSALSMTVQVW